MNLEKYLTDKYLLCHCLRGSHARGMATENSDVDTLGVYIAPLEFYFGFNTEDVINTKVEQDDIVLYELRKFIKLVLDNNPNILEVLWTAPKHFLHTTDLFNTIQQHRDVFVSKKVYETFSGYASSQAYRMVSIDKALVDEFDELEQLLTSQGLDVSKLAPTQALRSKEVNGKKLEFYISRYIEIKKKYFNGGGRLGEKRRNLIKKHGFDTKNAAVLIMLLKQAVEFLETGELIVDRSHDRDELLSIKNGCWKLDEVKVYADVLFKQAAAAYEQSFLPDVPSRKEVENLMLDIQKQFWKINA